LVKGNREEKCEKQNFTPGINKTSDPSIKLPDTFNGTTTRSFIVGSIAQFLMASVKATITNG